MDEGVEVALQTMSSQRKPSSARAATCWQPAVKGLTLMVNSVFNSYRFEDIWLDK